MDKDSGAISVRDAKIVRAERNEMDIDIRNKNFKLTATGFDENRDIIVDAKKKETTDETEN